LKVLIQNYPYKLVTVKISVLRVSTVQRIIHDSNLSNKFRKSLLVASPITQNFNGTGMFFCTVSPFSQLVARHSPATRRFSILLITSPHDSTKKKKSSLSISMVLESNGFITVIIFLILSS
jgi:hypothetical protein